MKLGMLSTILADQTFEEAVDIISEEVLRMHKKRRKNFQYCKYR